MTKVLLIGAGLSTQKLVPYLKSLVNSHSIQLRIVDRNLDIAQARLGDLIEGCSYGQLDITDQEALHNEIEGSCDYKYGSSPYALRNCKGLFKI